jgi:hypothetical protein
MITIRGYEKHRSFSATIFNIALYFITFVGINENGISIFPFDVT